MQENRPFVSTSAYIVNRDKKQIPISVSTSLLKDANGQSSAAWKSSGI
jgi:hypothetical protein